MSADLRTSIAYAMASFGAHDESAAEAVLGMIRAAGPEMVTVMPSENLLRHSIVITCHPKVYDLVRQKVDAHRAKNQEARDAG